MKLELSDLRAFSLLAETRHFGQAAERLHLSQPALTKQIQRLEAKLGGALIERHARKFALTSAGVVLLKAAHRMLSQADLAEQMVGLALQGKSGLLRIGFGIASLGAGLAPLLREHRRLYPHVEIALRDMSTSAQLAALGQKEIDVGFVRCPVLDPQLTSVPLFEERLVVALPSTHAEETWKGLQSVADSPFIAAPRSVSPSYNDHFLQTCRQAGFVPRVVQEAVEFLTVLHLVGAGLGVALVPRSARQIQVPHVSFQETGVDSAAWRIGLTWRDRSNAEPLVDNFVDLAVRMSQAEQSPPSTRPLADQGRQALAEKAWPPIASEETS